MKAHAGAFLFLKDHKMNGLPLNAISPAPVPESGFYRPLISLLHGL
jgi:hypothetical protein